MNKKNKEKKISLKTYVITIFFVTAFISFAFYNIGKDNGFQDGYFLGYDLGKEAGENGYPIETGVISKLSKCEHKLQNFEDLVNQSLITMNEQSLDNALLKIKLDYCYRDLNASQKND